MQLSSYVTRLYKKADEKPAVYIYRPLFIYWIILFILTSIPSPALPAFGTSDKIKHFGAYFVLTVLMRLAAHFRFKLRTFTNKEFTITTIVVVIYAFFDEVHQLFIPGRYFDWYDLLSNILGLICGLAITKYILNTALKG